MEQVQESLLGLYQRVVEVLAGSGDGAGEDAGFSTAELLGNAALAIAALVAIWGGMRLLGLDIVTWIRGQLGIP